MSLNELNKSLFIYQPVDADNNDDFYNPGSEKANNAYIDFCNAATMTEYTSRYEQGKLKKPNFDTIRKRIREFEEENEPIM